ncbi:hypothetical protein [Candidatus Enterovibrio escicola]|uniref:hypothetical protein n=1 Tax=Candidatus Enterovibrio escicola TaxID=1927127 RepID=UPI001237C946
MTQWYQDGISSGYVRFDIACRASLPRTSRSSTPLDEYAVRVFLLLPSVPKPWTRGYRPAKSRASEVAS